jgi:hypothetical protein
VIFPVNHHFPRTPKSNNQLSFMEDGMVSQPGHSSSRAPIFIDGLALSLRSQTSLPEYLFFPL